MKSRALVLSCLLALLVACAPEPAPPAEPEVAPPVDDAAAVDAVRAAYVEHYNLGHADQVAALFTEDAVTLYADGGVNMGREAIAAALTQEFTMNPTATISTADTMVMGDHAVSRGSYRVEMAPTGADPMGFGGNYMSVLRRVEGSWMLAGVIANYDTPPPAGMPAGAAPAEAPPDLTDHAMAALTAAYVEHFNQGHADVVAGLYDEQAVAALANEPLAAGRAAVQAALERQIAQGSPQLAIHTVEVTDLGDGWYCGAGWYDLAMTLEGAPPRITGKWFVLARTAEDGSLKIVWQVDNADPPAM